MSALPSRISSLSAKVSELTAALEKYHTENNIPTPSFDEHYWQEASYPEDVEEARQALSDACRELDELVTGPRMLVQNKIFPRQNYIDVIYNFDIPRRVPKDGSIRYSELAKELNVSESALRRLIRYAITNRIFKEETPGFLSHSAASRALAEEEGLFDFLGLVLIGVGAASDYHSAAMKKWPHANDPTEVALKLAKSFHEPTYYEHVANTPGLARVFGSGLSYFERAPGYSYRFLVDYYPWAELGSGTVVDMGGSFGEAAFAVAEKFPDLTFVVQDLPNTIASTQEKDGVNVKFMVHDFFEEQPIRGADLYMYRWCLHNHSDKHAIKILRALVLALKPGARILIMDGVMPAVGTVPNVDERALRGMDCAMMSLFNATEREVEEWKDLLSSADERFVWKGVNQPKGSMMSLIEAVWEPDGVQFVL